MECGWALSPPTHFRDCGGSTLKRPRLAFGQGLHVASLQSTLWLDPFVAKAAGIAQRRTEQAGAHASDEA